MTHIENDNKQEIDIGDVMELQKDILRDESKRGILRSSNLVSRINMHQLSLLVSFGFRDRDVEVDRSVLIPFGLSFTHSRGVVTGRTCCIGLSLLIS